MSPEARLRRTRAAYDDRLIAMCPFCEVPLTADEPFHDCGVERPVNLKAAGAITPASELAPPISANTTDDDYLWGV